jgi:hypothetical protein
VSLLVTACVFAGGVAGVLLHPRLPQTHLTRETHDVVKLGIGMVSVLASLVLGLLIATAKGSSDNIDRDIRGYAAEIIVLAETLRDYGAAAATPIDATAAIYRPDTARRLAGEGRRTHPGRSAHGPDAGARPRGDPRVASC